MFRYKDIWKNRPHGTDNNSEKTAQQISSIDSNELPATLHSRNSNAQEVVNLYILILSQALRGVVINNDMSMKFIPKLSS